MQGRNFLASDVFLCREEVFFRVIFFGQEGCFSNRVMICYAGRKSSCREKLFRSTESVQLDYSFLSSGIGCVDGENTIFKVGEYVPVRKRGSATLSCLAPVVDYVEHLNLGQLVSTLLPKQRS